MGLFDKMKGGFFKVVKAFFTRTTPGKILGGVMLGALAFFTGPAGVAMVGMVIGAVMGYRKAAESKDSRWYHRLGGAFLGSCVGSVLGTIGGALGIIGATLGCGAAAYYGDKIGGKIAPKQSLHTTDSPTKVDKRSQTSEATRKKTGPHSPERTPLRPQPKRKKEI
jgi:hypothetical protein